METWFEVAVRPSFDDSPDFRRLLAGDALADLTRIALEIARDHNPAQNAAACLMRIDALADRVRDRCPPKAKVHQILGHINWVLFIEERFRGNLEEYYDPRNSFLDDLLVRKSGIPISLAVLYKAVAERVGLELQGVNLPTHFVLRTGTGLEEIFVDPFHAGAILDRDGCAKLVADNTGEPIQLTDAHFQACSTAVIVKRMLNNLKGIYLRAEEFSSAVAVVERLAVLSPDDPSETRDLGLVLLQSGRAGEAIDPLRTYLRVCPTADDVESVRSLLRAAHREVASWN
jgi:regulator of sirC expression with transglutaminase-like and TPR domain